jgi:RsiW-degrading membrane proteinase PrsW (M82 family)
MNSEVKFALICIVIIVGILLMYIGIRMLDHYYSRYQKDNSMVWVIVLILVGAILTLGGTLSLLNEKK